MLSKERKEILNKKLVELDSMRDNKEKLIDRLSKNRAKLEGLKDKLYKEPNIETSRAVSDYERLVDTLQAKTDEAVQEYDQYMKKHKNEIRDLATNLVEDEVNNNAGVKKLLRNVTKQLKALIEAQDVLNELNSKVLDESKKETKPLLEYAIKAGLDYPRYFGLDKGIGFNTLPNLRAIANSLER